MMIITRDRDLPVLANYSDLARIWRNLISNAIKYGGEGKTIRVMAFTSEQARKFAAMPEHNPIAFNGSLPASVLNGQFAIGVVEDDGPGIRPEDVAQLFTRFFRGWAAQSSIPGTGLGLSLVKDILQSYGGDITVSSIPDRGATFGFWMPLHTV